MKNLKNLPFEKQFIVRQYNDKWKFNNYNDVIRKLQCNYVLSFSDCQIQSVLQDNYEVPVSTCKFSDKYNEILAVANENGIVCIENIKNIKALKYIQTHENTVYDIAWMPGSSQFVTVSGDNTAKLWDCKQSDVSLISTFTGHKRSVRCVSFKPENTAVFATGSRDGSLMIWDTRAWKKCTSFSHHVPDQIITPGSGSPGAIVKKKNLSSELLNSKSVTGLVFQNDNTLISCGSMDRYIKVWDMRKTYSRSVSNALAKCQLASPKSGFSYLCVNTLGTRLYANCMDSYIYCFNINSFDPDPVAAFCGHENGSFYVKSSVSANGLYLMSGSSDECAYIWNTENSELSDFAVKPLVLLSSHTAEVTAVEMSPDNIMIVSCSDDGTFRLWNPYKLKNDERGKVDVACPYDAEEVSTVKIKWKNKRKFKEMEEIDQDDTKSNSCSSHTKICRFYTTNHSSTCICYKKFIQGKGEKRKSDDALFSNEAVKKKADLELLNEETPRKQSGQNLSLPARFAFNISPPRRSNSPVKISSKRKLSDLPDFIREDQKTKKPCERILTPSNTKKNDECGFLTAKILDRYGMEVRSTTKENHSVENKGEHTKILLPILSSPTSNLPNYVKDGTSPYIHKCPKITQKENDWLTKLRKKYRAVNRSNEKQPSLNPITSSCLEKRKKGRSINYTLHKYFKVSSRATEKPFSSQELQKKGILAMVENQ